MPGFKEALEEFKAMGLRVVLWTSRFDPRTTTPDEAEEVRKTLEDWCAIHGIVVDEIDIGCLGKRLALAYVDDRGVRFAGDWKQAVEDVREIRREVDALREARNTKD